MLILFFSLLINAQMKTQAAGYPTRPDAILTPGSLCRNVKGKDYCERNVSENRRNRVIEAYLKKGYQIRSVNRDDFKIDHFIPLCFGGSNDENNLWPQHVSLYQITDDIENVGCIKIRSGRVSREKAIELIKKAKLYPSVAPHVLREMAGY